MPARQRYRVRLLSLTFPQPETYSEPDSTKPLTHNKKNLGTRQRSRVRKNGDSQAGTCIRTSHSSAASSLPWQSVGLTGFQKGEKNVQQTALGADNLQMYNRLLLGLDKAWHVRSVDLNVGSTSKSATVALEIASDGFLCPEEQPLQHQLKNYSASSSMFQ